MNYSQKMRPPSEVKQKKVGKFKLIAAWTIGALILMFVVIDPMRQRLVVDSKSTSGHIDNCNATHILLETAVADKATAEAARETADADKATAEAARETADADKATAEAARDTAVADKATAEAALETAVADKATAEAARETAIGYKNTAETALVTCSQSRELEIGYKNTAEAALVTCSQSRELEIGYKNTAETALADCLQGNVAAPLPHRSQGTFLYTTGWVDPLENLSLDQCNMACRQRINCKSYITKAILGSNKFQCNLYNKELQECLDTSGCSANVNEAYNWYDLSAQN